MAVDILLYILLGVLILAIIIGGSLLRSRVNRGASRAGDAAGRRFEAAQLAETLGEFGTSVVIHAAEPVAREVVAAAMSGRGKHFVIRDDGRYGIRFIEPDDTILALDTDPDGVRLQVQSFREYLGFPQTAPLWTDLRARITAAAEARGIPVTGGAPAGYRRGGLLDDRNARWDRDA